MQRTALAVLLLTLAGCAGAPETLSTTPAPQPPAGFTLSNDASGCVEELAVLLVTMEQAQSALPPGWTAADARGFLGTPSDTGRGLAWVNGYQCQQDELAGGPTTGAELAILVAPPTLQGGEVPDADFHLYELAQVTSSANVSATLRSIGFPVLDAAIVQERLGLRHTFTATASADGSELYSVTFVATPAPPLTGVAVFWNENADGTAYLRFQVSNVPLSQGIVTECSLGSTVADLLNLTECPATALGVRADPMAWASTLEWMPGAHTAK